MFAFLAVLMPGALAAPPEAGPTLISADRVEGQQDVRARATGDVHIQRNATRMTADEATYDQLTDELDAKGNVHLIKAGDTISGPRLRLRLDDRVGEFESPHYTIERRITPEVVNGQAAPYTIKGSGKADMLYLEGENRYRLKNASFSTCEADDPAWYLKAKELNIDMDRGEGSGSGGTLYFEGVPIGYSPVVGFPISGQRRSGFLVPTIASSNATGPDISTPYYFNLAPNYDDTLSPRVMTRRGVQINNEFRYLGSSYRGSLTTEWVPYDRVKKAARGLVSFVHDQNLGRGFSGRINFNHVSDSTYFADLTSRVTQTSTDNLVREATVHYSNASWLTASAMVQRFQTLTGSLQYNRLPQLTSQVFLPDVGGFTLRMPAEAALFQKSADTQGWRSYAYPQVSYNLQRPGWFITPKLGLHLTRYDLSERAPGTTGPLTLGRTLPVASLDAGLIFERDAKVRGKTYTQTLEPRLYYLKVPYRDQSRFPVFDTSAADYGFSQIFSENVYVGQDRVANADQLTAAVVSRFIKPENGVELARMVLGSRFSFVNQQVSLPGETPRSSGVADLLAAFSGRVLRSTQLDLFSQYNPRDGKMEQGTIGLRYQPDFAKALSFSYRYNRNNFTDTDTTAQWPIYRNLYAVARVSRDWRAKRLTQAIGGLEYNGGCWVLRVATQTLLNTSGSYTNAYYLQLELGGVIPLGNNPVSLLERNVVGYGRINRPVANPVFGRE